MEFIYEGFNGYDDYAYIYNPTRTELEKALAIVMLWIKGLKPTSENIVREIKVIQEKDLIDTTDVVKENYEEIKQVLRKSANLDL